ncbi:hypothetical protein TRL7639_02924 [Falsiruegeria litorea R37]|uniref:DUF1178 family protein n=1 Tax=Falsiruegeria litorea R37 TaxID=1200284 RepID=A0A1Y5T481_9RHOB|nr:DUF1178 family protein [Falsiruegeria litorea]SLN54994.1 hypothetical protein TRL7639_02924 [Falsiruegeria litorea R37]
MIQYALKCSKDHSFDSWFQSAEAYDKLAAAGMVSCVVCGDAQVEKAIMTPRVRPARSAVATPPAPEAAPAPKLSEPTSDMEKALAEARKQIEENSDYVGKDFVSEARAMHEGEAPERSIYGEANLEDAKSLIDDGVPVTPLPFMPNRKTN